MKNLILIFFVTLYGYTNAQEKISLDKCYELVRINYPLSKQNEALNSQLKLQNEIIGLDKLPKVSLNAQATYQSEVTQIPFSIPNATVEPLNKDQYRATLDVNQLIYNGGLLNAQSKLKEIQFKTQQQQIEVSLYQLKNIVNQYFFGILLLQEKNELLQSKMSLLIEKNKEVKTAVKFGAILPASEQVLEAEIIKIQQQINDLQFDKRKLLYHLEKLTATNFDENTILENSISLETTEALRPEFDFFNLQNQQLEASQIIVSKSNLPKLNAFIQGGYGNPALNMLNNSFEAFYVAGIRLNWTLFDWNKTKKEKEVLEISKQLIASEKETFQLNLNRQLQETDFEIQKINQQLKSDEEIIDLRQKIVKSSEAQMKNGVITTSEYLNEIDKLFESKNNQKSHQIQLQLTQANYQIIKGN